MNKVTGVEVKNTYPLIFISFQNVHWFNNVPFTFPFVELRSKTSNAWKRYFFYGESVTLIPNLIFWLKIRFKKNWLQKKPKTAKETAISDRFTWTKSLLSCMPVAPATGSWDVLSWDVLARMSRGVSTKLIVNYRLLSTVNCESKFTIVYVSNVYVWPCKCARLDMETSALGPTNMRVL